VLDQKVTGEFPTLEALALGEVRKQFPKLRRSGFSKAVRAAFRHDQGEDLYWSDASPNCIPIIPDGWFEERVGAFTCVEIEDGHPLTPKKLWDYCHLYNVLDYCDPPDYGLRLLVFDPT
jgi:hypothetical protein